MPSSGFPSESIHRIFELIQTTFIDAEQIFDMIVEEAIKIVEGGRSELFVLDEQSGESIRLRATTDEYLKNELKNNNPLVYKREKKIDREECKGEGLTGWIFRTGKPLCINSLGQFAEPVYLSDDVLCKISDDAQIDEDDRIIQWCDKHGQDKHRPMKHYLGVPIQSQEGEVIGVLRVSSGKKEKIEKNDLKPLIDLATIASILLYIEKQERLKEMLIKLGAIYEKDDLFDCVVNETPQLILGRGCSIFLLDIDENKNDLELSYTNSHIIEHLTKRNAENKENILRYKIGKSKTGLVAKLQRTMIINYYGTGRIGKSKLESNCEKWEKDNKNNIVRRLYDKNMHADDKNVIGLFNLHKAENEPDFSPQDEKVIDDFLNKNKYNFFEIMKASPGHLCETSPDTAISFLALPIKDVKKNLIGVLRIPRTFAGSIFTDDDVAFIESIINRLTIVLEKELFLKVKLEILNEINSKINASVNQDKILELILAAATDGVGFENNVGIGFDFATIQLIDKTKDIIQTAMVRRNTKIPDAVNPEWIGSEHSMNPPYGENMDIHVWILIVHQKEVVIKGWNNHFDKEIYDRYGHDNLIRAFVPIYANSDDGMRIPIGTLEAGYNINRKTFIDDTELEMLKALANQAAIAIKNSRQVEAVWKEAAQKVPHKMATTVRAIELNLGNLNDHFDAKCNANNSECKRTLENLSSLTKEILGFLNELKEFSSKESDLHLSKQNLQTLINKCIETCGIENKIKVVRIFESDMPIVIDSKKIAHCFNELLFNAADFVPKNGGMITICGKAVTEKDIERPIGKAKRYVKVNVKDNGDGIQDDMKEKIFDLLFSGRPQSEKSSGIGLAITRKYIQQHNGIIREVGTYKTGADFEIILPISDEGGT
jgi:signal transduction histidine kinase